MITIDILHLVDRLETLLAKSWRIPFTSNLVIQEDDFLDIIDQMRVSIPEEVRQARRMGAERERMLEHAQEEAERIVGMAREQVDTLTDDHELVVSAQARAEEIVVEANRSAESIKSEADVYVMETLSEMEEQLLMLITTVRNGIQQVQRTAATKGRSFLSKDVEGGERSSEAAQPIGKHPR